MHLLALTRANRDKAIAGIDIAIEKGRRDGKAWLLEIREPRRTDDQNRALWSLLSQIAKQRPTHNGVKMNAELWKSVFLQALGAEMVFVPTLDGAGMFPLGHRSSQLNKTQFADLLEIILAWTAQQGITVEHFDDGGQGPGSAEKASPVAA